MGDFLDQLEMRAGASEHAIDQMLTDLKAPLPADYVAFLRRSNGAVGHGPDLFVILEPAERIREATIEYGAAEYYPGLVVIGGDGCGNLLGINGRSCDPEQMEYVVFDPVWLDLESESCQHRSKTLQDVFAYLVQR